MSPNDLKPLSESPHSNPDKGGFPFLGRECESYSIGKSDAEGLHGCPHNDWQ